MIAHSQNLLLLLGCVICTDYEFVQSVSTLVFQKKTSFLSSKSDFFIVNHGTFVFLSIS